MRPCPRAGPCVTMEANANVAGLTRQMKPAGMPGSLTRRFRSFLTRAGIVAAHPVAFIIVFCYVGAWIALNPDTFDWHAVATITTWSKSNVLSTGIRRQSMRNWTSC